MSIIIMNKFSSYMAYTFPSFLKILSTLQTFEENYCYTKFSSTNIKQEIIYMTCLMKIHL